MTKRQTINITILSVIAFILAMLVLNRFWFRMDFTKNKSYTISKVSKNLYREIPEPVNITYYVSDKLKTVRPEPGEIEDTLREYAAFSRGMIRLTVRDPVKAGLTETVEELGIQPRQLPIVEKDQSSLITVYSGIVIEYLNKVETLPFLFSIDSLEYDITSRIRAMISDTERQIGVIVGDSFRKFEEDFRYLYITLANAGYRVREILPNDEIPEDMPALFVFGGTEELDDISLYRIDRYIQMGGKALFAVKGVYIDTIYGTIEARKTESKGLLELIASYGVTVRPNLVLDRNALMLQYQTRSAAGRITYRIVRYPLWIGISGENGNPQHPVSTNFSGVDMYWASPLELNPPDSVNAEILFTSSEEAWLQTETYYTSPEITYMLEIEAAETRGTKILGAALTGVFPSFYGSLKPEEFLPDMPRTANLSRIIVIGDVDFATNMLTASDAFGNLDFLLRAADWLANDDDIISIRSKQPATGRLDRILDPVKKARAMRFSEVLNVGIIPALVIVIAFVLAYRRRKNADKAETIQ